MTTSNTDLSKKTSPFCPPQVYQYNLRYGLKSNHKLLSDEQITQAQEELKNEKVGCRYPKSRFAKYNIPYAILKGEKDYYAIYNTGLYLDQRTQLEINKGGHGKIKLALILPRFCRHTYATFLH